jgi:hypothetical protein
VFGTCCPSRGTLSSARLRRLLVEFAVAFVRTDVGLIVRTYRARQRPCGGMTERAPEVAGTIAGDNTISSSGAKASARRRSTTP